MKSMQTSLIDNSSSPGALYKEAAQDLDALQPDFTKIENLMPTSLEILNRFNTTYSSLLNCKSIRLASLKFE